MISFIVYVETRVLIRCNEQNIHGCMYTGLYPPLFCLLSPELYRLQLVLYGDGFLEEVDHVAQ